MANRKKQYYADMPGVLKMYMTPGVKNPCLCGGNCFHQEFDESTGKVFGVCSVCGTEIYEVREEYASAELGV